MQEKFHIIIPARYASTRLKAKVLLDIAGKPMLQHVYERARQSSAESVVIATDDERIKKVAESFSAPVCLTSKAHTSGTSRLAETVKILGYKQKAIIVGLQADEPLIAPVIIDQVASDLANHRQAAMATLCEMIESPKDLFSPNITKVVIDKNGFALYFSRSPIPWERDNFSEQKIKSLQIEHYRHIGIYAYRVDFLYKYAHWQPTPLESAEGLEQLRAIYYRAKIHVSPAKVPIAPSVDTKEALAKIKELLPCC